MSTSWVGLERIFAWLLTASWQASVLALLVLAFQWAFGSHLNPRWRYALWLLVIVRLLMPFQVESALSIFRFTPAPSVELTASITQPIFHAAPQNDIADTDIASVAAAAPSLSTFDILALLWLAGVAALGGLTVEANRRFARHVFTSREITDPAITELFAAARSNFKISRTIRLVECSRVSSPAIMGLFSPTLILPTHARVNFDEQELRLIFLHELAHLKRGDVIVQGLIAILQILHWFNPLLWFAFRRMRDDREPATDALVLSRSNEGEKERYGLMLIKLLEHFSQRHSLATLVGILEDKDSFKRRFTLIGQFTRGAYGWSLLGVGLLVALAIAGLTRAHATSPTAAINSDARIDFEISGQSIPISAVSQDSLLHLLHELLIMRYVNGTPDTVFHWENLPGSSVEQIKASGSFLHVVYLKKPSIPVGTSYTYQADEVWIGLQDNSSGDSYPGRPGGISVVTSGKDGIFNLMFGSKSLLTGIGLIPGILPHLSPAMQKSLGANRPTYQGYLDWMSATDTSGQSVNQQVITAVQAGDVVTLKRLMAQGIDITKVKSSRPTLLFDAASPEVAELLIQHGVDVKPRIPQGSTALDFICRTGNPKAAAIARILLEHGADPNAPEPVSGQTPALAAYRGDTLYVLVEHGADLKATDRDGYGVLFHAGRHDVTYLQSLMRHGVVFDPKKDGPTVLVQATWINNVSLIKWLLDHGVDPSAQGLWVHMKNGKDDLMFPLEAAAISGQPDAAKLLLDHGGKCDTAIALALQNHYENIVRLLWEHGARNISELCYAISQHASANDLMKILQKGAPVDSPLDTVVTALGEAAETDNLPAVQLLVQHGADVNRGGMPVPEHSEYHDTPLVLAAERGQDEIVAYLLQHGAQATPNAVSGAANAGIPGSFYVEKQHLPSKEHYERVTQMLIDAGALKDINPEWTGRILAQTIQPCWGAPDPLVLQKLLAAGLSPEVPLPFLEERGDKPNSVIGYYRDFYAKNKDDPSMKDQAAQMKPLLDMLEAAATGKQTTTSTAPASVGHSGRDESLQLISAIGAGDTVQVNELLDQGANANSISGYGESALQLAVSGDHPDIAQILLEKGADPNAMTESGSLLVFAQNAAMVRLLLQHGASLQPKLEDGETLIESVASMGSGDNAAVIDELIREGAPFDAKGSGVNALDRAAARNLVPTMKVLLDHGVDLNAYSDEPRMQTSPLRNAAGEPSPDAVKFLLDRGANPSGNPRDQGTPLEAAVSGRRPDNEALLRKAGANDVSELASAAAFGDVPKALGLLKAGANVDRGDGGGRSPLAYAVTSGQVEVAKLLLGHGAEVNVPNSAGLSPAEELQFTAAFFKENPGLDQVNWNVPSEEAQRRIGKLQQLLAAKSVGLNDRDSQGRTVLHRMAFRGNPMVAFFAGNRELRADPNIQDNDGNTALLLAALSPRAKDLSITTTIVNPKNPDQPESWNTEAYIAHCLVRSGAKLDLVVRDGKTVGELAMQAAVQAKNAQLISVLREAGAPDESGNATPARGDSIDKTSGASASDIKQTSTSTQRDAPELTALKAVSQGMETDPIRPPASMTSGSTITGRLTIPDNPETIDFVESTGRLLSVVGVGYDFKFQPDGSFTIPNVQPGVYNRSLHIVKKLKLAGSPNVIQDAEGQEMGAITITDSPVQTMDFKIANPFAPSIPKDFAKIQLEIVELKDIDDHKIDPAKIDAALAAGDVRFFQNLPDVDLVSLPPMLTAFGQPGTMECSRELPYPNRFDADKNGKFIPAGFTTADLGIKANVTPFHQQGKIQLNVQLSVTDFDGFATSNMGAQVPTIHTQESNILEELPPTGEAKGVSIPGTRFDEETITDKDPSGKTSSKVKVIKGRLLVFLSAETAK